MSKVDVTSVASFRKALEQIRGLTHGDTIAMFIGLRFLDDDLPHVGDAEGVGANELEDRLDDFYTKEHPALKSDSGRVCSIFTGDFKRLSRENRAKYNNWRDFFRLGNGVGCLASDKLLTGPFLSEPREECQHLVHKPNGDDGCGLHEEVTRYIRGLDKPKFLQFKKPEGSRGKYRLTNIHDSALMDAIRPLACHIPIEPLMVVLYFGAPWHDRKTVSVEQFAQDFGFEDVASVDAFFASEIESPAAAAEVAKIAAALLKQSNDPFVLKEQFAKTLTTTEKRDRNAAFRKMVLDAYGNGCAVCGLKVATDEGTWEVQAAHIYPHAWGGTDDVRNGIALCHNHHWAFDQGLWGIAPDYALLWKPAAKAEGLYVDTPLALPKNKQHAPDQKQALAWHRKKHGFAAKLKIHP